MIDLKKKLIIATLALAGLIGGITASHYLLPSKSYPKAPRHFSKCIENPTPAKKTKSAPYQHPASNPKQASVQQQIQPQYSDTIQINVLNNNTLETKVISANSVINEEFQIPGFRVGHYTPKNRKTRLFLDGKEHNSYEPYLSISINQLILSTGQGNDDSPSLEFLVNNGILNINDNVFSVIQANKGTITLKAATETQIPTMTAKGEYTVFIGNQVVRYESDDKSPLIKPNTNKLDIDPSAKQSVPLQIATFDLNGNRIRDYNLVIDAYNRIKAGTLSALENGDISFRYDPKFGPIVTSSAKGFHELSKHDQDDLISQYIASHLQNNAQANSTPILQNQGLSPFQTQHYSGDSYKPSMPQHSLPFIKKDGIIYRKIPNSSKYISPAGKVLIVN